MSDPLAILLDETIGVLEKSAKGIELLKNGEPLINDTPTGLYELLKGQAGLRTGEKWWPANSTQLGHKLTLLDGPLRCLGIMIKRGKRSKRAKNYLITRTGVVCQPAVSLEDTLSGAGLEASTT